MKLEAKKPQPEIQASPQQRLAQVLYVAQTAFKTIDRPALACAALYSLMGFAALAYSTRLTFSGPKFTRLYGDGNLTSTYLAGCTAGTPPIDRNALHLLQRYEWHCPNPQ